MVVVVEMMVGRGDRTVNQGEETRWAAAIAQPPLRGVECQGDIPCLAQANIFECMMRRLNFLFFFYFKEICIKYIQILTRRWKKDRRS